MAKKFRKSEHTVEGLLRAMLEVMGWQAELTRAALRLTEEQSPEGRGRTARTGKSAARH